MDVAGSSSGATVRRQQQQQAPRRRQSQTAAPAHQRAAFAAQTGRGDAFGRFEKREDGGGQSTNDEEQVLQRDARAPALETAFWECGGHAVQSDHDAVPPPVLGAGDAEGNTENGLRAGLLPHKKSGGASFGASAAGGFAAAAAAAAAASRPTKAMPKASFQIPRKKGLSTTRGPLPLVVAAGGIVAASQPRGAPLPVGSAEAARRMEEATCGLEQDGRGGGGGKVHSLPLPGQAAGAMMGDTAAQNLEQRAARQPPADNNGGGGNAAARPAKQARGGVGAVDVADVARRTGVPDTALWGPLMEGAVGPSAGGVDSGCGLMSCVVAEVDASLLRSEAPHGGPTGGGGKRRLEGRDEEGAHHQSDEEAPAPTKQQEGGLAPRGGGSPQGAVLGGNSCAAVEAASGRRQRKVQGALAAARERAALLRRASALAQMLSPPPPLALPTPPSAPPLHNTKHVTLPLSAEVAEDHQLPSSAELDGSGGSASHDRGGSYAEALLIEAAGDPPDDERLLLLAPDAAAAAAALLPTAAVGAAWRKAQQQRVAAASAEAARAAANDKLTGGF